MRVLLLTQPTDGGVFKHVGDLARGLLARGHEVVVAAPPGARVDADVVPLAMERGVGAADARAVAAYVRAVRRLRPDVVHAHSSKAGAVARVARAAVPRIPVLYTAHGYAFAGYFSARARRAYREIERALAPLATRVVCVCEAERRLAASVGPPSRTRVVHNGIDPGALPERSPAPGPVVTALALFRPGKGLETLIDAAPRLVGRCPDVRIRIIGSGPDREALEARARANGVAGAVELVAPRGDLLAQVGAGTVFVHPSWAESFPYAILEAMAMRMPVVATAVGGVAEAVDDGSSGLVVPPRDAGALADAVAALLGDPGRAAALGAAARERVLERFTIDRMVDGVAGVYAEVV